MKAERHKKPRPPLDAEALERLALFYVGRYATTRAKLRVYLARKVRERGWAGDKGPDLQGLTARLAALNYIDDVAFAASRAAGLQRRGYGERRVRQMLEAAGIEPGDRAEAEAEARNGAMTAALRFARRRRLGPFASERPDRDSLRRAFAAMARAGHSAEIVRRILGAAPEDISDLDQ